MPTIAELKAHKLNLSGTKQPSNQATKMPTIAELKAQLKEHKLNLSGTKPVLEARIAYFIAADGIKNPELARIATHKLDTTRQALELATKERAQSMDGYTVDMVMEDLQCTFAGWAATKVRNALLKASDPKHKMVRNANLPCNCSENVAKFTYMKKYGVRPNWNSQKGDLTLTEGDKLTRIEVKGETRSSGGPVSFGKTETWDFMMFVRIQGADAEKGIPDCMEVLRINLSNVDMGGLKISETENYGDACAHTKGQRPRAPMDTLLKDPSFEGKVEKLWSGSVAEWDVWVRTE
jgi:hypothetical protein